MTNICFFSRDEKLGRMWTTIAWRKSRTRPSCERITCLGRTRVMRLPDSAECHRCVDVVTDMCNTRVLQIMNIYPDGFISTWRK